MKWKLITYLHQQTISHGIIKLENRTMLFIMKYIKTIVSSQLQELLAINYIITITSTYYQKHKTQIVTQLKRLKTIVNSNAAQILYASLLHLNVLSRIPLYQQDLIKYLNQKLIYMN